MKKWLIKILYIKSYQSKNVTGPNLFTTTEFRELAFQIAEKLSIDHPFSKNYKKTGKDWLNVFLKRHPEISIRRPEPTSIGRAVERFCHFCRA